ncbi:MAG: hypothetical protein Q9196_006007 [Gyalolechia fulgens]
MLDVNRIGFTELPGTGGAGDRSLGSKSVNIILVHGLRGHPYKTWTSNEKADNPPAVGSSSWLQKFQSPFKSPTPPSESNSTENDRRQQDVFWPLEFLAKDIFEARVWTYGYNADVIGGLFKANNKNSVSGHGRDLAVRLERDVGNEDPIVFLAHSLGGIVVKDAIRRSSEACRRRIKLIIFLGTPHRGSSWTGWGKIASNLARVALQDSHKKIIETLEVDSEVLENIHDEFVQVVSEYDIRIHSFQEGRAMSGIKGLDEKVVSDFSSKLGLPKTETVESIDANHMQMARCTNRSDESYRFVAGVLKQFLKNAGLNSRHQAEVSCSTTSYCIPFLRNQHFVGRTKKLKELEEKLMISSHCQKLALVGLGGVGKTQVALQFAYTVKEHWHEYSIFWAPAISAESFEQAYRDIATQCSIALDPNQEDPKESVRRYLNSDSAGKWLLIVDNADDEEIVLGKSSDSGSLTDYLPQSQNGLTLFTTRHREIAVSLARNEVVEVQEMDQEEAEAFLKQSLIQKEMLHNQEKTTELLNELAFLPLAIAQAAAYLNAMQNSIPEYLSLLRSTEQDTVSLLSREFCDHTRYKTSKNSVAATWLVSFDQIRRSDSVAADLLSFLSCIEYKAIPRSILPSVDPEERMVRAVGTLRAYAFITRREDSDSYDMHRLVHLATKVWLDKHSARDALNEKVATHLAEIFPLDDYSNRVIWREYLPHALQFLRNTKTLDIEARYDLCIAVGRCLRVDGRDGEAVLWLSKCFLWRQGRYPEDHPSLLSSQHALAVAYEADGQVKEAVKLLQQVVIIREKVLREDHPDRLASQYALALVYQADGQVKEAVKLIEHVVVIREKVLREDHPDRLASQQTLAIVYQADGQVKEAVKLLEHLVITRQKVLKEDHPLLLSSQHTLAWAYEENGQVKEAVMLLEHVVAIQKKIYKEDYPNRLASQHELAGAYVTNGQVKEAFRLLQHVVAIKEKVFTEDHTSRLASQHELARVYYADGQVKEAVKLLEHVVAIKKKALRVDHPDRLISQNMLLDWYAEQRSEGGDETETSV